MKLFQFGEIKTQHCLILQKGVKLPEKEIRSFFDSLRDFLKTFENASKYLQIPLAKPKDAIGSTKAKDNLFVQNYNDIIEHPNRQFCLSFWFQNNKSSVFNIQKFEIHGNQFFLTKIVNTNHREIHHLSKNRYYVANRCEKIQSKYNL